MSEDLQLLQRTFSFACGVAFGLLLPVLIRAFKDLVDSFRLLYKAWRDLE